MGLLLGLLAAWGSAGSAPLAAAPVGQQAACQRAAAAESRLDLMPVLHQEALLPGPPTSPARPLLLGMFSAGLRWPAPPRPAALACASYGGKAAPGWPTQLEQLTSVSPNAP